MSSSSTKIIQVTDGFISRAIRISYRSKLSHLRWAIPQTRNRGSTFILRWSPRCQIRCQKEKITTTTTWYFYLSHSKDISYMLTNGAIFSSFKYSDPHSVRGRSTLKDGLVNEHTFRYRSFCEKN